MGRGLSDLQKDILLMAYENEQAGHEAYHDETGPVITAHVKREQILRERFGWQPDGRFGWFCRNFSRTDIGHDRYNATMASLSLVAPPRGARTRVPHALRYGSGVER